METWGSDLEWHHWMLAFTFPDDPRWNTADTNNKRRYNLGRLPLR